MGKRLEPQCPPSLDDVFCRSLVRPRRRSALSGHGPFGDRPSGNRVRSARRASGRRAQVGLQDVRACLDLSSSATGAWEEALVNVLSLGGRMLMFETGHFATLWRQIANRLEVEFVAGDWRHGVPTRKVEVELAEDKEQKTARSTRSRTRICAARPACRGYPRHRERLELELLCANRAEYSASLIGVLMPRPHAAGRFRALTLDKFDLSLGSGLGSAQRRVSPTCWWRRRTRTQVSSPSLGCGMVIACLD